MPLAIEYVIILIARVIVPLVYNYDGSGRLSPPAEAACTVGTYQDEGNDCLDCTDLGGQ